MASLKEEILRAGTEKTVAEKKDDKIREKTEHRRMRLNVALVARSRAENLTQALVTEFV